MELKTSAEWQKDCITVCHIIDPDGWDKNDFYYSWSEERITKQEFGKRAGCSTCVIDFAAFPIWLSKE